MPGLTGVRFSRRLPSLADVALRRSVELPAGTARQPSDKLSFIEIDKMKSYSDPTPCNLNKRAVSDLAKNVAKWVSYTIESPNFGKDLSPVVASLGGAIEYTDLREHDDPSSGSVLVEEDSSFTILLPRHTSPERDRYTIAHEIGHVVLHHVLARASGPEVGRMRATRYGSDRTEWEANWFAASFLMPDEEFQKAFEAQAKITESADLRLAAVARIFGVSLSAAEIRARALKLL